MGLLVGLVIIIAGSMVVVNALAKLLGIDLSKFQWYNMAMRINDKGLRRAEKRQKQYNKKKNGMRVDNKNIFVLEEQKKKKGEKANEK